MNIKSKLSIILLFILSCSLSNGGQYPVQALLAKSENKNSRTNIFQTEYDAKGNVIKEYNDEGFLAEYAYNQESKLLTTKIKIDNSNWAIYENKYDENNRLIAKIGPSGEETRYIRNEKGLTRFVLSKITNNRWMAIKFDYDIDGNIIYQSNNYYTSNVSNPDSDHVTVEFRYGYDHNRNLLYRLSPDGCVTNYKYNENGLLVSESDSNNATYEYQYDSNSRLAKIIDPLGGITEWIYDNSSGYPIEVLGGSTVPAGCKSCGQSNGVKDRLGKYFWRDGLLVAYIDTNGEQWSYEYDVNGNLIREVNPLGGSTTRTYDDLNFLSTVTDPVGVEYLFENNKSGKIINYKDGAGDITRYFYDLSGRMTGIKHPDGGEEQYKYNPSGKVLEKRIKISEDSWATTQYEYNLLGLITQIVFPDDTVVKFEYTANGNKSKMTLQSGDEHIETSFEFNNANMMTKMINAHGDAFTFTYDSNDNIEQLRSFENRITKHKYDALNRIEEIHFCDTDDVSQQYIKFSYDSFGNIASKFDGLTTSFFEYDESNRLVTYKFGDNADIERKYNALGNVTEIIQHGLDRDIVLNRYSYDSSGRLTEEYDENGLFAKYTYDEAGRVSTLTTSDGLIYGYKYDSMGRVAAILYPNGNQESFLYNFAGGVIEHRSPAKGRRKYELDAMNRIAKITDANGKNQVFTYNILGKITSITNALEESNVFEYDKLGRKTSFTNANGNKVEYYYDKDSLITGIRYPDTVEHKDNVESYVYDSIGRVRSRIFPDGGQLNFQYAQNGKVSTFYSGIYVTEGQEISPENIIAKYHFNSSGFIEQETGFDTNISYEYDEFERITAVNDYNSLKSIGYEYYDNGLKKNATLRDHGIDFNESKVLDVFEYRYNHRDQITEIAQNRDVITSFTYDDIGRLSGKRNQDSMTSLYGYDSLGRMNSIESISQNKTIFKNVYIYDDSGNITDISFLDGSRTSYTFDDVYRLLTESRNDSSGNSSYKISYQYDRNGNRLSRISGLNDRSIYEYNERDQLVSIRGSRNASFRYDKNGNAIAIHEDGRSERLAYDVLGRVVEQKNDARTEVNHYLGISWKRWKTIEASVTETLSEKTYVYDHDNVLASFLDGSPALRTVFSTTGIDNNHSMSMYDNSGVNHYFYAKDILSSIRTLVNAKGDIISNYDYTAFGETIQPQEELTQPFGFTGRERKQGFSDINYRHRNYYPEYGRFMRSDPAGFVDGPNSYTYVSNRPNVAVDPYGLWSSDNHTELTSAVFDDICGEQNKSPWRQWIIDANVGVDGTSLPAKWAGAVWWQSFGFGSFEEGAQHYMIAHRLTAAIENELWVQAITDTGYLYNSDINSDQEYRAAQIRYNELVANDKRINDLRSQVKKESENRIQRLRTYSTMAASTNADNAAMAFGQALHTLQDRYAHTNADYLPLLDTEHTLSGDSMNSNETRYAEALEATRDFMENYQKELCESGVNICAE